MNNFAILDLGTPQLIIILVIVLLLFGSKKLPELARSLGSSVGELRKGMDEGANDRKKHKTKQTLKHPTTTPTKAPFIEHLHELRRRLFLVALSIVVCSIAAYAVEHSIINFLLAPSHGQSFIYTSPLGGLNFLIKVCFLVGIVCSIPVMVYHLLRYTEPLMKASSRTFVWGGTVVSGLLALAGMAFGYFIGLPAALEFLLNQFITQQVQPLLTIEAYLSFVSVYMLCAALMFQIPLIVLFINRIKPLKPRQLFGFERWVILLCVILAFIMNPTPNVISQLFIAIPMILSYQLTIGLIWLQGRGFVHHDILPSTDNSKPTNSLEPNWQPVKTMPHWKPDVMAPHAKQHSRTSAIRPQHALVQHDVRLGIAGRQPLERTIKRSLYSLDGITRTNQVLQPLRPDLETSTR